MASPPTETGTSALTRGASSALALLLFVAWVLAVSSPAVTALIPAPYAPILAGILVLVGVGVQRLSEGAPWSDTLERWADLDLFAGRRWVLTALVYLVLRAPLLLDGSYGADPDAWRMVSTGVTLWEEHSYQASRLPGYPVPEILLSPFVAFGGPQLSKLAVAAVGFALLYAFDRLGRALGARTMGLATLALATSPTFLVQTTSVIDYVFSLGALLAAMLTVARGQILPAAGWIGVAFASRVTSALYALPLLAWARARGEGWLRVGQLALFGAQAAAILFIPVLARYQAGFVEVPGAEPSLALASASILGAFGLAPLLAVGLLLGDRLRPAVSPVAWVDRAMVATGAAVGLTLFALLPQEAGYLLPPLVLLLLLAAATVRPAALALLALAGLLSLAVDTQPGSVRGEAAARAQQLQTIDEVLGTEVDHGSLVLLGSATYATLSAVSTRLVPFEDAGPWKRVLHDPDSDVRYVPHLPQRLFEAAQGEGRTVYVWSPSDDAFTSNNYGFSPLKAGAILLHGRSENDRERKRKEGWEARPREAVAYVTQSGREVELRGWSEGVVRACLTPTTPVDGARRVKGAWSLEGQVDKGGFKLLVIWQDAAGAKVGTTPVVAGRQATEEQAITLDLTPPEGAAEAQLCASLDGVGMRATLDDVGLER